MDESFHPFCHFQEGAVVSNNDYLALDLVTHLDLIAEGIVTAVKEVGVRVPVIVRLEGTNVEQGKQLLNDSGLAIIAADDLNDAAQKVVAAAA